MNLRLTFDARRGWDRVCRDNGVSLTALVEAIGLEMDDRHQPIPPEVIELARTIDHDRKTRR